MFLWIALTGIFFLSWAISFMMSRSNSARLLDQPVERSAHKTATPRGGGLAIVVGNLCFLLVLYLNHLLSGRDLLVLMCAIPVAVTGFVDDLKGLRVRIRLPVHLLSAFAALALLGPVPEPFFSGWLLLPTFLQSLVLMLALVWLLNLYNFMDGIDALAAVQCLFVSASAGLLLIGQQTELAWVCAGLFFSCLGFLMLNLPPAKIFMGDIGSTFLGFFLGLIALISHFQGSLSVWVWVLLMGSFIADTTYTLFYRAWNGHRLTEGHNTHAYQHLARRTGRHMSVVLIYAAVNIIWLLPMSWLAVIYPQNGVLLAISGIVPLMLIAALAGAGKAGAKSTGNATVEPLEQE
ncbi:MAG: glycosyltransferase family 4 protein [Gammaproteobacteria bacterium]|nr:glycosyltransferase family 4 protein [Gammaproteobacteria bacterium]